jgi:uncharacterized RDD family membrane protein YckC
MEYEDRRTIATPEGVDLELPLAGLGSRFIGLLLDTLIQTTAITIAIVAFLVAGSELGAVIVSSAGVLAIVGYYVLFEVAGGGRTPGKRAAGVRVVMDAGGPVGLRASLIRNIIRLLEGFATLYVPAVVSVLASRNNQRLGDHAAGTLVIRDRRPAAPAPYVASPRQDAGALDATGVSEDELAIVSSYLARREGLAPQARRALAAELAGRLRPRVAGARADQTDEQFLEQLFAAKAGR